MRFCFFPSWECMLWFFPSDFHELLPFRSFFPVSFFQYRCRCFPARLEWRWRTCKHGFFRGMAFYPRAFLFLVFFPRCIVGFFDGLPEHACFDCPHMKLFLSFYAVTFLSHVLIINVLFLPPCAFVSPTWTPWAVSRGGGGPPFLLLSLRICSLLWAEPFLISAALSSK